jgi:hypothetical protein
MPYEVRPGRSFLHEGTEAKGPLRLLSSRVLNPYEVLRNSFVTLPFHGIDEGVGRQRGHGDRSAVAPEL